MAAVKRLFGNWWFLSVTAALLAVLAFAVLLPLVLSPLRPWPARTAVAALIGLVWGGLAIWRTLSARRRAERLAGAMAQTDPADAEAGVLAERMRSALTGLKTASGGKRDYLYSRPWYVIIGPPGAGKTTALLNSGLRFPYSESALKGVGGTRNLDFWFADRAVLVDTAGRYTTQDSEADRDRGAWNAFLGLLKRNRPLQPINGVLVAIGLDELVGADVAAIDRHSAAIRRRLAELQAGLSVAAPVYVMFTKSDLVAGFSEYFDDLDVEGRRAVLGATLPWTPGRAATPAEVTRAFDEVAQSVADRQSKRLQEELDLRRRALVVGFPVQFGTLRSRVMRFLDGAFPSEGKESPAPLRGFYFTSGVQQGAPLDRILSGVAAVYDAPVRAPAAGQGGRAYFINRLLHDVVMGEAGLVRLSPEAQRRQRLSLAAGFALIGAVSFLLLGAWTASFFANRDFQARLQAGAVNSTETIRTTGLDLVETRESDPDLEQALAALRGLRNLPGGYAERRAGGPPLTAGFGLYQHGASRSAEQAYQEALQRIMLPRILLALERRLRDGAGDALGLYEPLKIYLTLGGQAPSLDRDAVKTWVGNDWAAEVYPGADREAVRNELSSHLDALLEDPQFGSVWPDRRPPLDGALIADARSQVQTLSVSDRAYALLRQQAATGDGADWSAAGVLSSGAARAFANGEAVRGLAVPYFYTKDGFAKAYQGGLGEVQGALEKDVWVLGGDGQAQSVRSQMSQLRPGVAALYAADYIRAWEKVLAGLAPADYFQDPAAFGAATAAPSPLKLMLMEVSANTKLLGGPSAGDKARAAALKGAAAKAPAAGKAAAALGGAPAAGIDAGREITNAFAQVHAFAGAPVDDFIAKLRAAVTAKGAADRAGGMGGGDAAQAELARAMSELASVAATAPPLVQSFAAQASSAGDQAQVSSATGAVTSAYDSAVAPACRSVTEQRYPFVTASQNDAPVGDLLRVFGMNGQVDNFTNARLMPLLDTSGPVWRWRADDPVAATLDPTSGGELQKAAELRDLLMSGVPLKVEASGFGGATTAAELSAGGVTHRFEPGQGGQRTLQWTVSSLPEAKVTLFQGAAAGKTYSFEGPWALFRLMDAARKENAGPTAFRATFGEGASFVTLRVVLPSERNPFSRGGMWSFRCPPRL